MRVGVTGASGLIGTALTQHLRAGGHTVVPFVRRAAAAGEIGWDPQRGVLDPGDLEQLDAVVNLAGAGIGDRRWSDARKREIRDSRVHGTTLLAEAIARAGAPGVLLSGSAIGIYGDRGDEPVDERSAPGDGYLSEVATAWEAATAAAAEAGTRVAHLRSGIVLSRRGGALKKMLPLFKLGAGGRFGSGKQWMSWIAIDDEVGAIGHLLTSDVAGAVNLTSPGAVRNAEFARQLATALHRPAALPVPKFGPRLLLGRQLADNLLFEGQRVEPGVLLADGYQFRYPELAAALAAIVTP
jgi:uncharacterized protein (TIGR01777 family)